MRIRFFVHTFRLIPEERKNLPLVSYTNIYNFKILIFDVDTKEKKTVLLHGSVYPYFQIISCVYISKKNDKFLSFINIFPGKFEALI